jgi:hypothetical protein
MNALTENHTHQMEALIRSMTEAMKEMMTLVKTDNKNPTNANNGTNEKKINRQERLKRFRMHLYAHIATENTQTNQKTNAGNLNPTHLPAQPTGSLTKTPEGTRGQQSKQRHGNREKCRIK